MRSITVVTLGMLFAMTGAPRGVSAADRVEIGNVFYRIVINDDTPGRRGLLTTFTGPTHPVSLALGRPGEILSYGPDYFGAPSGTQGYGEITVRSYDSRFDYRIANGGLAAPEPDLGFPCLFVEDAWPPLVDAVTDPDGLPRVRATWYVVSGDDEFMVVQSGKVIGSDLSGGAVEVSLTIRNLASTPRAFGMRQVLPPRIGDTLARGGGAYAGFYVGIRPPDPPAEPFGLTWAEWVPPRFRMWQLNWQTPPPVRGVPWFYSVAGLISGGAHLQPRPTPPAMLQHANIDIGRVPMPGISDQCFEWHVPDPPLPATTGDQQGMASYFGWPETEGIQLGPGEEATFTQYLVAFLQYPLETTVDGPPPIECDGATMRVPVSGAGIATPSTDATIFHDWSSTDPRVTFADSTAPATEAIVEGVGEFPVTLNAAVGAYEAAASTVVRVVDTRPPKITTLRVTPDRLWPPNHRLVPVHIDVEVADICDDSPSVRLVAVESSEADDARRVGDGHTLADIQEADLAIDDRDVKLRAERNGTGPGRTYTLTYEVSDASGNSARESITVAVDHDQRRPRSSRLAPPR